MKILVSIIILFLSYQLIAEEVIVCELNELSNSTDWNFYNEGETTQENIKIPKYRYYIIDDINKKITHFKTLYINRGSGTFVYDENLENILPFNKSSIFEKTFNILHFTEKEIIFNEYSLEEIEKSNKETEIFNNSNKDTNIFQLNHDVHYFFELDRVLGLLVVTGLEVDIEDNSYKLTKNGFLQNLFRKTYQCYGKNFIQITN